MLGFLSKIFGSKYERDLKLIRPMVEEIHRASEKIAKLNHDELRSMTANFRKRISEYIEIEENEVKRLRKEAETAADIPTKERLFSEAEKLDKEILKKIEEKLEEILPEAFAVVKETAKRLKENPVLEVKATELDRNLAVRKGYVRISGDTAAWQNHWMAAGNEVTWDMVHYDVQLIGGIVLHQGKISEMATGEGKTLVATLPVYLNALPARGVHIVTVNNYLSRRDSEWNGPLFEYLGLTVDCIDMHEPNSSERRAAYNADITYGTNNEFGFDYLRDNMARELGDLVQRKHHYAIVDEVDSVLIDDARTPLIISGPTPRGDNQEFQAYKPKVEKLFNAQRNYINTALADAKRLIAEGKAGEKEGEGGIALLRAHRGLPKNKALIKFLSEQGNRALLLKTENHYMAEQNKHMPKVDAELFFVIDEKNNSVELTEKGIELITSSTDDRHFFVLPDVGAIIAEIERGAGTEDEKRKKKDELLRDYSIKSERVHTVQQLLKAYALFEKDVDYILADGKVKIVDEQTGRVLEGRRYSDGLHQAIEAKENVKVEAATQTYATITLQNYFRMYHKLAGMTGTAETEAQEFWNIYKLDVVVIPTNRNISRKDHNDLIYKTKREKYTAVIEEIVKCVNAGRPVLVGTTSVEISELLSKMLTMRKIRHNVLNAKLHQKEAEIVQEAGKAGTVTIATNMAGRGTDIKLGPGVREAGGLAIVGTERHESRRVDRQLRGRAGRQGDPGSSQFFVSMEDDLMRLFGSERITKMMDRVGYKEGDVIQSGMISGSIERAQKKVEENNFGIRKRLIEYDDVMNAQRDVIYTKRRNALFGDKLAIDISNTFYDVSQLVVSDHHEVKDYPNFNLDLIRTLSVESPVSEEDFNRLGTDQITAEVFSKAETHYAEQANALSSRAWPVIKNVYETQGQQFENIVVPITDGIKTLQLVANLKKAYETQGASISLEMTKSVVLAMIDDSWKEHLREMDDLKTSVQNAVYEQKDPLLIYKFESFNLFNQMLSRTNREVVSFLSKCAIQGENNQQMRQAPQQRQSQPKLQTSRTERAGPGPQSQPQANQTPEKRQPIIAEKTVGRNDPCPCGSGKKYKNCHGA
ncbi:MAG: preprotein translocase subunit SecA [Bacteroidia bacterium]|nr:preprotein translocase subunit SecA [Bacteroidia bacterium]